MSPRKNPRSVEDCDSAVKAALALLLGPYEFSVHTGRSPADCGLPWSLLHRLGVTDEAMVAALEQGYIVCSSLPSRFGKTLHHPLEPHTLVTLTEEGANRAWHDACARHRLRSHRGARRAQPRDTDRPHWDRKTGWLWRGTDPVLCVRRRSSFQWMLFDAFQRRGWRKRVEDPLGHTKGYRPDRLIQTVKDLNRRQKPPRLKFVVEADGESVSWDWLEGER